jgi:uncharacterized integral membrane protein
MNDIDADVGGAPSADDAIEPPEQETTLAPAGQPEPPAAPVAEEPAVEAEPTVPEQERVFAGTGLVWGLVVGVLLAVVILILVAQNTQNTTIEFLAWEFSTPVIVVILAALVVGVVVDELIGLLYRYRRRRTLSEREQLKRLQTRSEA